MLTPPTPATEALPTDVEGRLIQAATEIRKAEEQLRKARNRLDSAIYDAVRREGHQVAAVAIAARGDPPDRLPGHRTPEVARDLDRLI